MDSLETYIPSDRRWALARGQSLPDRAFGAVLFADVSGFTSLAEVLTRSMGVRRGAEELTKQLNRVYEALIAEIETAGGSVIAFAGDAALCWFNESDNQRASAAVRAVTCAFLLQRAMRQFTEIQLPDGTTCAFAIKVTVAYGSVRRFLVGDETLRRMDVIAGSTVARTAMAEHLAHSGQVLVDTATAEALGASLEISEWLEYPETHERFALARAFVPSPGEREATSAFAVTTLPASFPPVSDDVSEDILKTWVHPTVYQRTRTEGEAFLTELRPVVALFARFQGIAFDTDDAAGEKLDHFIARAQQVLARYDGALLELTIGDKGSYFYATFGAPHTHEDDARRAVFAARELFPLCSELGFIEPLQIGISQGVMRVGAYGGSTRRTYGAQGDEVNLAARLMTEAAPGTVLVSGRIQKIIANEFDLEPLPPIRLKGKSEPLLPFVVQGLRETRQQQLQEAYYALPMIGREHEFALIQEKLEQARGGQGQIVGIVARAGMGKSRLTAEIIRAVRRRHESSYGGECQSFGANISYLVWAPIWRAFFGLDQNLPPRRQVRALEVQVTELVPERAQALPLLGAVLNLSIAENEFTSALEPQFRKSALHALLLDCLRAAAADARAERQLLLIVIEDAHWIDPASRELLQDLASNIASLPILILLNYRPPDNETEHLLRLEALPNFTEIGLHELTSEQGEGLVRAKIALHAPESTGTVPAELIARVTAQAQGNPFYIEQLLDYMHDRGTNLRDAAELAEIELPPTLHRLILSRIDQLNEQQQLTLKAASIIGRWFTVAHLCGYFPRVGTVERVRADLALLQQYDLTLLDQPEPALAYLFKHIVTHQVAYDSLAYATRAMLHEAYARFLETHDESARALDVITYHYDRSENLAKRREFLSRAGTAAAARFANIEAVDYLTRALALTPEMDKTARYELLSAREQIFDVQGEREQQRVDLNALEQIAHALANPEKQLSVWLKQAWLAERMTNHAVATETMGRVTNLLGDATLLKETRAEFETEAALVMGVIHWQQGNTADAKQELERALALARTNRRRVTQARALSFLGTVYREAGELARAESHFREQQELAGVLQDRRYEWAAFNNLGLIATARGDADTANANYTDGLRIVREIGDRMGEGLLLSNLAITAMDRGEFESSETFSRQALALANAVGDRRSACRILLNLGESYRLSGEYAVAKEYTTQALEMARRVADRLNETIALMNLGALAVEQDELEQARGLVGQALPLAREIGHREGEGFLLNTLGQTQFASGETDAARDTFESARRIWETLEPMVYALDAYAALVEISLQRADASNARACAEKILAYLEQHPSQHGTPAAANAALAAYHALERANDARGRVVLEAAQRAVSARAENIADETRRRAFLENVRAHRELAQTAREVGIP